VSSTPSGRCTVRQSGADPAVWLLDFDPAAPGGRGGASVALDLGTGLASIAAIHRNDRLPRRSTGELLAEGLAQTALPKPSVLEAYNVIEATTRYNLETGGTGEATMVGRMLARTVAALGGTVVAWEPVADGQAFHLRVRIDYP
jgi:hypothetical protein